ncbi:DUF433 domain-containing protein [Prosthecomicrobium sp. N25]|uniref:DUF433 domain-containing protein n=1 Tax=Prosthecomicrobium sp. N25 TaxID=3129254 RepID=UPI003077AF38
MAFPRARYPQLPAEIVSNPEIMGGRPCIAGTRIPADAIVAQIRAGLADADIFRHYPGLPVDGIEVVRTWALDQGLSLTPDEQSR